MHDLVKYVYMNDDRLVSTHMIIITLSYWGKKKKRCNTVNFELYNVKWVTPEVTLLTKYNTAQWTYYLHRRWRSTCVAPLLSCVHLRFGCLWFAFVADVETLRCLSKIQTQPPQLNPNLKEEPDLGTIWQRWVLRVAFRPCTRPPETGELQYKSHTEKWGRFTVVPHTCRCKQQQNARLYQDKNDLSSHSIGT